VFFARKIKGPPAPEVLAALLFFSLKGLSGQAGFLSMFRPQAEWDRRFSSSC
jgi:hypothetical protein